MAIIHSHPAGRHTCFSACPLRQTLIGLLHGCFIDWFNWAWIGCPLCISVSLNCGLVSWSLDVLVDWLSALFKRTVSRVPTVMGFSGISWILKCLFQTLKVREFYFCFVQVMESQAIFACYCKLYFPFITVFFYHILLVVMARLFFVTLYFDGLFVTLHLIANKFTCKLQVDC